MLMPLTTEVLQLFQMQDSNQPGIPHTKQLSQGKIIKLKDNIIFSYKKQILEIYWTFSVML